jgi:predicted benzoate:H+ symporter BenE
VGDMKKFWDRLVQVAPRMAISALLAAILVIFAYNANDLFELFYQKFSNKYYFY